MKKIIFFTLVLCLIAGSTAMAADMTKRIGLGFVTTGAPVGGRYWFSPKVGLDLGFGLNIDEQESATDPSGKVSYTDWRVFGAVPIKLHSVGDERVNFNLLPGVQFATIDQGEGNDSDTDIAIIVALEFEVFVTESFSVSGSHGLAFDIYSPGADGRESTTDVDLFGSNVTEFGLHYYLPGGE